MLAANCKDIHNFFFRKFFLVRKFDNERNFNFFNGCARCAMKIMENVEKHLNEIRYFFTILFYFKCEHEQIINYAFVENEMKAIWPKSQLEIELNEFICLNGIMLLENEARSLLSTDFSDIIFLRFLFIIVKARNNCVEW